MRMRIWFVVALTACSAGDRGRTVAPATTRHSDIRGASAAGEPTPPTLRLPTTVRPLHNTVEITLVPRRDELSGTITIDLDVAAPTDVVWLNATDILVDNARVEVGTESIPTTWSAHAGHFLGLRPAHPLVPGRARAVIHYRGKMRRNDGDGIYSVEERGSLYAFTHFEPTDARQAFPCFDEPSYKVPWKLSIRTERALTAVANTPIESEQDEPDGMKLVRFVESRPLPSYLVAFAVGPFEAVDAGNTPGGAPIRIVVPRGRTADAAYPAQIARPLLVLLESYFGTPYPYSKLDLLAVPVLNVAAMENPGLITFRQSLMLTPPRERTEQTDKVYAYLSAHELAHQWFGNYVTLAWWDDTWLNESFATWIAAKLLTGWKPEWEMATELVNNKDNAIAFDALDTARAIRQPIASLHDVVNSFDNITYAKGSAVLTMLERWIGPDMFQAGVRRYLARHAWGNATYDDFAREMSAAGGREVRPLFDPFIVQSGAPLVTFELECARGAAPKLKLSQRRYVPMGSHIDPDRTWHVPVCVRWGADADTGRDCVLLDSPKGELVLGAKSCPDWVLPNDAELGYYRVLTRGKLLDKLLARASKVLTLSERVGTIGDVKALVASGDLATGTALRLVEHLAKDPSRYIADALVTVIAGIDQEVPAGLRANYERLIRRLYRARAIELGWHGKPGEDDNTRQLRSTLLWLVAGIARDRELSDQASALVVKWFGDRTALEPDLVGIALNVAAHRGGRDLFDRVLAAAKQSSDRNERVRLLGTLGAFTDRTLLARAMVITLTDEFELRESISILQRGVAEARNREAAYGFVKDHFDELVDRLPAHYRPYLASTFVALCDERRKPEIEAFFRPRIERLEGGPRILEQALESLSLCAAAREAQATSIAAFLKQN